MSRTHGDQDRVFEWREIATLAELELLLKIAGEIMVSRKLNRGTEWCVGLHENFAGCLAASGASCDLCEKLESAFACAEIGKMQGEISVDDTDKRYVRKMQTFRDHLRADENIDLAGAKIPQGFTIRFLTGHRIRIHAAHHRLGENLGDR